MTIDIDALKQDKRPQSSTIVHALIDRLEVAESARRDDYQNWMTALDRNAELLAKLEAAKKELAELRAKIETVENDAAHQKALAASALRVAEGWERKCGELRVELETERMRLAACGVVALANTPDSAKQAREMRPEYWSASCGDVARMVDENIKLLARIREMERQEPVAKVHIHQTGGNAGISWSARPVNDFDALPLLHDGDKLYALPGAKGE